MLTDLRSANVPVALATSSHRANYILKTSHLPQVFSSFSPTQTILGDDARIPKGRGKPAPDIYFLALETINHERRLRKVAEILPAECLVFEDSVPGIEAGRRAGMQVVWCPHPELLKEFRGREVEVLTGIAEAIEDTAQSARLGEATSVAARTDSRPVTDAGRWAHLVHSLEDLDLSRYGISAKQDSGRTPSERLFGKRHSHEI